MCRPNAIAQGILLLFLSQKYEIVYLIKNHLTFYDKNFIGTISDKFESSYDDKLLSTKFLCLFDAYDTIKE